MERRADTIYLYGVDRMSTRDCLQYFEDYGPSLVEWLDDSSCNVVFGDGDSAKRAVVGMGRPFGPGEASDLKGKPDMMIFAVVTFNAAEQNLIT